MGQVIRQLCLMPPKIILRTRNAQAGGSNPPIGSRNIKASGDCPRGLFFCLLFLYRYCHVLVKDKPSFCRSISEIIKGGVKNKRKNG